MKSPTRLREWRGRHHAHLPYYLLAFGGAEILVLIINHGHL